jgi:Zn-dependent metalloprotease
MKRTSVILIILTLLCQVVFSQNSDIIKSFYLQIEKPIERLESTNIGKALNSQFGISENYEFKRQVIKGTKDRMSENDGLGYVHEHYTQYYKGIKIEHSDIRVHYLNGLFTSANGEYIDAQNIDVSIILSKEEAVQKAIAYIGAKKYIWEDEKECEWLKSKVKNTLISCYPEPETVICRNIFAPEDTLFYMAYKVDIRALEPFSHNYVYVDAKSGTILSAVSQIHFVNGTAATRYSGTKTISTQRKISAYRLRGYDNNRSIETYNMNGGSSYANATDFTDNDNNWTAGEFHNTNKDDAALEAHWCAMMTWDYFKQVHGRNSFNNNGATIENYVNANLVGLGHLGYGFTNNANAFWDRISDIITYGNCVGTSLDSYVTLDVVAHEFSHGVCAYTAKLVYEGEPGAINESLSDIWGACVENYVNNQYGLTKDIWSHREEVGSANRSLSTPGLYEQPNTYGGGAYWIGPYAGVHINSGIMNHWFYILSVGKSGTNDIGNAYNVTGIGISKAEKIVYRAETVYMTAITSFVGARNASIQAATDLYGANSPEVVAVTNAWYAVGVGSQYPPIISGPEAAFTATTCSASYTVSNLPPNLSNAYWTVSGGLLLVTDNGTSGCTVTRASNSTANYGMINFHYTVCNGQTQTVSKQVIARLEPVWL